MTRRILAPLPFAYALLAVVCGGALLGGYTTQPPAEPVPVHRFDVDKATPVESLTHQLEQAYEMDRITQEQASPSAPTGAALADHSGGGGGAAAGPTLSPLPLG